MLPSGFPRSENTELSSELFAHLPLTEATSQPGDGMQHFLRPLVEKSSRRRGEKLTLLGRTGAKIKALPSVPCPFIHSI